MMMMILYPILGRRESELTVYNIPHFDDADLFFENQQVHQGSTVV
jgi:hypothetical protein